MAENVGGIFYTVDMDARQMIQQQQRVINSLKGMDDGFARTDRSASRLTTSLKPLAIAIGGLITIDSLRKMQQLSEATLLLQARITRLSDGAESAAQNYRDLLSIASRTGAELKDTVALWESMTASLREMGATNPQILGLTETLQKIGSVGGSSAQEMSAALRQFGQAISGGVLRAEEFNSIIEQMPELARTIARGLGIPFNEMRQQMLDGELTAQRVLTAIQSQSANVNAEFEKMPRTTAQAGNAIKNNFGAALANLDKTAKLSETIAKWMDLIADGIRFSSGDFSDHERYNLLLEERRKLLNKIGVSNEGSISRVKAEKELIPIEKELLALQEKFKQNTIESGEAIELTVKKQVSKKDQIKEQNAALREQKKIETELAQQKERAGSFAGGIVSRGESQEQRFTGEFEKLQELRQQDLINAQQYESAKNALSVQFAMLRQEQLKGIDPIYQADAGLQDKLAKLQTLHDAELIEEQRFLQLKNELIANSEAEKQALAEQTFRKQSELNEFMFSTFDALGSAGANAMSGLLTGTMTAQDAMRSLAMTILNQAIGALVSMGIQQVKNLIMGQTAGAAATAATIAQAGAISAAMATPAALTSLATLGANAIPAQAGITATIGTTKALSLAGGRQYGGPVSAGGMYRINENGAPEIYQAANGRQYMMPNSRGEVISNRDATSGGGAQVSVIVNNNAGADIQTTSSDDGRTIEIAVNKAVNEVAGQINGNRGPVWSAMKNGTNVNGRTR